MAYESNSKLNLKTILTNKELFRPVFEASPSVFEANNGGLLYFVLSLEDEDLAEAMRHYKHGVYAHLLPSNQEVKTLQAFLQAAYKICDQLDSLKPFGYSIQRRDVTQPHPQQSTSNNIPQQQPSTLRLSLPTTSSPLPPYTATVRSSKRTYIQVESSDSE